MAPTVRSVFSSFDEVTAVELEAHPALASASAPLIRAPRRVS
jgi:hypothetical protein